jgi:hypothetical protein
MSALKNDGSVFYGSKVLTVGVAAGGVGGTTYVADNLDVTRATASILRTNELGEPSGRVVYKNDVDTFTCTLQLASSATIPPTIGWETTVTFDATNGAEIWYLDKLGETFSKDGEVKCSCTFVEKLN